MGHVKKAGLQGAAVGVVLALVLIGLVMWRLGLWRQPFGVGGGELNILWNALPYLAAIVVGALGVVGGLFGMFVGWCSVPNEEYRYPPKDSRHPLE
jgi:hypothetical protein